MEGRNIARFPRPVFGRIPNFVGAEEAARRLAVLPQFQVAEVVKVNPDSPQRMVRMLVLSQGKTLLVPTPRLRYGFILLEPRSIPRTALAAASTIGGASRYGERVELDDLPGPDLIVVGSVAVSIDGARIGKGGGYSEIEFAILRELGKIDEATLIATTVHDVQIVEGLPMEEHDVPVELIVTPTKVIETRNRPPKPRGVMWDQVDDGMMKEIPVLAELYEKTRRKG